MEYNQITSYIFLGTNQCCGVHFGKLIKLGVDADVDLEGVQRKERPHKTAMYVWLPTRDKTAPTQAQLLVGAKFLKGCVLSRTKVYVHCKYGHGRSPTLVAAYFILVGLSVEQALEKIKEKRPEIHLTPTQIQALKRFVKYLR